jgi:hypothetical protein
VRINPDECRDPDLLAAEVRRLRAVIAAGETTFNDEDRTPQAHATPGEGSVRGEGAVGKRLVTHVSLSQSLLNDNEKLRAEIDQLREAIRRLADQDATLSVQGGNVIVTLDATLTDEEREAIEQMLDEVSGKACAASWVPATLRSLLERLK